MNMSAQDVDDWMEKLSKLNYYSRPSVAYRWLVYHSCFKLVLEFLGKNPITADIIVFEIV